MAVGITLGNFSIVISNNFNRGQNFRQGGAPSLRLCPVITYFQGCVGTVMGHSFRYLAIPVSSDLMREVTLVLPEVNLRDAILNKNRRFTHKIRHFAPILKVLLR